jgi:hypothetical protein
LSPPALRDFLSFGSCLLGQYRTISTTSGHGPVSLPTVGLACMLSPKFLGGQNQPRLSSCSSHSHQLVSPEQTAQFAPIQPIAGLATCRACVWSGAAAC